MKYNHVVLGGTFDLLHLGHQDFLSKAFGFGKFVTIGLTSDKFNKLRGKPSFQNQKLRLKNLRQFLKNKGYLKRSKIVFINDIFGTTLNDPTLEAIVVTSQTKGATKLINQKRIIQGLGKLDVITLPFTKSGHGQIISSTSLREGKINILGQSYKSMLLKIAGRKLSDEARKKLKKPLGSLISLIIPPNSPNHPNISVGDITTANLLKVGLQPKVAIVDNKVGRKKIYMDPDFHRDDEKAITKIKNPPGQISKSLILAIDHALQRPPTTNHQPPTILVDGEEDLATIPAILLSPLGTTVFYGQPKRGMVEVNVDFKIKNYLCKLLNLH